MAVTTQYHYPLAPLNYCLQLASVIFVLLGVIVRTYVILHYLGNKGDRWPYMLDYVAVAVPQSKWTPAEDVLWQTLLAICNGLANVSSAGHVICSSDVQITHIQFLTLLYPSRTEARLIFIALGERLNFTVLVLQLTSRPTRCRIIGAILLHAVGQPAYY